MKIVIRENIPRNVETLSRVEKRALIQALENIVQKGIALYPKYSFRRGAKETHFGAIIRRKVTLIVKIIDSITYFYSIINHRLLSRDRKADGCWLVDEEVYGDAHMYVAIKQSVMFFIATVKAVVWRPTRSFVWSFLLRRRLTHLEIEAFMRANDVRAVLRH